MVLLVLMSAAIFVERFESLRWSCWVRWTHGLHASVPSPKVGSSKVEFVGAWANAWRIGPQRLRLITNQPSVDLWWSYIPSSIFVFWFHNMKFHSGLRDRHEGGGQGSGCRGWGGRPQLHTRERCSSWWYTEIVYWIHRIFGIIIFIYIYINMHSGMKSASRPYPRSLHYQVPITQKILWSLGWWLSPTGLICLGWGALWYHASLSRRQIGFSWFFKCPLQKLEGLGGRFCLWDFAWRVLIVGMY